MFGYGVVFYLYTVDMKEPYFAFQGTVQKSIAQGMRVSCTLIYSIGIVLSFCSVLACVQRGIGFEGSDLP